MHKLLIAGVSAFALLLSTAVYAQSSGGSGGSDSGGGNTGGGGTSAGSSGGDASGSGGQGTGGGQGVDSDAANSDTTEQRKDCPPGAAGVNCQPQPAQ